MRPVVNGLQEKYGDRVAFAGVDYYDESNRQLFRKYEVLGHPTFVILDPNGKVVEQLTGFVEAEELEAAVRKAAGVE